MGDFPSGQRGQTVNLLAMPSVVRIHHPPPKNSTCFDKSNFFIHCESNGISSAVRLHIIKGGKTALVSHHTFRCVSKTSFAMSFFWWGMVDSNHRRHSQQIYSLSPLATREIPHIQLLFVGAGRRTRTPDLLITNQLLYQLSYTGGSNRTRLL